MPIVTLKGFIPGAQVALLCDVWKTRAVTQVTENVKPEHVQIVSARTVHPWKKRSRNGKVACVFIPKIWSVGFRSHIIL